MKLEIKYTEWPERMVKLAQEQNCKLMRCCVVNGWLSVFVTIDAGLWHLSVSHPRRYPSWDEIKAIRYALLPDERTFAILFPPMAQYINLHQNCFHLHEVPELHEQDSPVFAAAMKKVFDENAGLMRRLS